MSWNFPLILVLATVVTGIFYTLHKLVMRRQKMQSRLQNNVEQEAKQPASTAKFIEAVGSIFPVLLAVLIIRSFLFEPFQIPSGSMIPTLKIGDFILVNKFDYGLRLPVTGTKIISMGEPKRGDVMVFKEPSNPSIYFIKRVVGLPGDVVSYHDKQLTINGKLIEKKFIAYLDDSTDFYNLYQERLGKHVFNVRNEPAIPVMKEGTWHVPKGQYFVMGDNRDRSNDSRYWGYVPEKNIVGRAFYIWLHWPKWSSLPNFSHNGRIQ